MPNRASALFRRLLRLLVCAVAVSSVVATAQTTRQVAKIGSVAFSAPVFATNPPTRALVDGMRELGYVEGRQFVFEVRSIEGKLERFAERFSELAQLPVDLIIVGVCGVELDAARRATRTIPIVVPTCNDDLVELGVAASLNRPGGNVTGLTKLTPELAPKRLQMLKQAVPAMSRVAVLWNPAYSEFKADWRELRVAAVKLGVTLHPVEFRRAEDLEGAFAAIARERPDALIMFSDQLSWFYAKRVADLANAARLPAIFAFREIPDAGGLMSYGPNLAGMWRQAAGQVVKILQGAKAGDIPIEQPTRFELVINRNAAKTLGITIPTLLLVQANDVVD